MIEIKGKYTLAKIFLNEIDEVSEQQIIQIVNHQAFENPVRIMPDTHAGSANSVIGFTMPLGDKIIPNTVGVDIGCGMISVKIEQLKNDLNFDSVDKKIRQKIAIGNDKQRVYKQAVVDFKDYFPFDKANEQLEKFTKNYNLKFNSKFVAQEYNYRWFGKLCQTIGVSRNYVEQSLGSLGGGNHFIEIGESTKDKSLWLTVHSGSRNLGKKIADFHSKIALDSFAYQSGSFDDEFKNMKQKLIKEGREKEIEKMRKELQKKPKNISLDFPKNMTFLSGQRMYNYFVDMIFAQIFAQTNRQLMIERITRVNKFTYSEKVESVHNYIDFQDFVIRKGAIRSYIDEKMIIPFNMADGILICEGKSNKEWNFSAPHGAGRLMSRRQAKANINFDDFQKKMKAENVFSTSINPKTLDEAPQAYKSAEMIEKAIQPTAKILFKLKPLYNLKAF
ncbi:MAG: RtcB family protein [Bacteroidota bacterium]|nr:RtcB family protein [Bacteroidota bacterium]